MKGHIIAIVIFLSLGSAFLYFTYLACIDNIRFLRKAIVTQGQVVRFEEKMDTDSDNNRVKMYYPIVSFQAGDSERFEFQSLLGAGQENGKIIQETNGKRLTFESALGSGSPAYKIGQTIKVAYDPARPEAARIYAFTELWFGAFVLSIFGINFFLIGLFFLFSALY